MALFVYARPVHLRRTLACLRENGVPLLCVFADGAKGSDDAVAVAEVRAQIRGVDWCEVRFVERDRNMGLGRNVLSGVGEVAAAYEAFIVWEDDLVCVPGTYAWMCAALRHYARDSRVMSVTGWTHPRVKPAVAPGAPYFDGRGEGWVWGTWSRCWSGMTEPVAAKQAACRRRGLALDAYGADLPEMAAVEQKRNIWAVRWYYHHLQHRGLCLRPPWSMVDHIGVDAGATNAGGETEWSHGQLAEAPAAPPAWPEPREEPECARLWRRAFPPRWRRRLNALVRRWRLGHTP